MLCGRSSYANVFGLTIHGRIFGKQSLCGERKGNSNTAAAPTFGSAPSTGGATSAFGQPAPPPSYGASNPSQGSQGGFNFGAAAASPPSFAFGSASQPSTGSAAPSVPSGGFNFGGSQQAPPTFGAMQPQTPQQQQNAGNMFSIGAGPAQPPKGRTIARARRTRR